LRVYQIVPTRDETECANTSAQDRNWFFVRGLSFKIGRRQDHQEQGERGQNDPVQARTFGLSPHIQHE
jgi:hypothetical protein